MKKSILLLLLALIMPLALGLVTQLGAQSYPQYDDYYEDNLLSPSELDDLLAPIALYPDPLIAQILPAATFTDQIQDAARYVQRYGRSRVDYQPWDYSVRAVAHYPKVLYMMDQYYDWTVSLGQAYIEQPQDVMDAIQRLRYYARVQGNLYSTPQQEVIYEGQIIRIVPARPQYIYIPVYDPQVIYVEHYRPSYPLITFSVGFTIGAWLNRDCDWRDRRVYYHGWRGRGWISRARPHIRERRDIYINKRAAAITVNQRVVQQDTRVYRQQLRNDTAARHDERRFTPLRRAESIRPARPEQRAPAATPQRQRRTTPQRAPATAPQRAPATAPQRAPATVQPPAATTVQPPAAAPQKQQAPAAGRERKSQPPAAATGRERQSQPAAPAAGRERQPATERRRAPEGAAVPGAVPETRPATGEKPPAATTPEREPRREGQGEGRRRVLRQINRPAAPQTPPATPTPPAAVPERKGVPAPQQRVVPMPEQKAVPAPAPAVVPTPVPRPERETPRAVPAPRSVEPKESRPQRERRPDAEERGSQGERPEGTREPRGERRSRE